MQLLTPTQIAPLQPRITHSQRLMVMGSCFAAHIGGRLAQMKWRTEVNPFGVLYNPLSIAEALTSLLDYRPLTEEELTLFPDGGWNTWLHHSSYSLPERAEALDHINTRMERAAQMLGEADTLIITLGTAWVYRLKENGRVVGNCHKEPERMFERQRLTVEDIVGTYDALLGRLWGANPKLRILFTVSPVRHLKDGLHGNQLSKATLLLAVDELCAKYQERVQYFPAYEIVMDELRDYRFYAEDMAHPSQQAVDYVWERFVEHCVDAGAQQFMQQWEKVVRALEHRPFNAESEQYQQFVRQNLLKIAELKDGYPYVEVQGEVERFESLLKPSRM